MALIGDQIRKQMELTAALMSDPSILNSEPSVVASSFAATLKKIDLLQVYLRPRDGNPTPRCDASIINDGVKQMVYLAMDKQMQPLKEPLPPVVDTDLRKAYDPEYDPDTPKYDNLAEREIRESNCMAAMVLVQYYVEWYLLLMQINQLEAPFRDENMDKDIEALQNLPTTRNLLEFRPLKGYFAKMTTVDEIEAAWTELAKESFTMGMMVNPGTDHMVESLNLTRQASAVMLYQLVLSNLNGIQSVIERAATKILTDIHHKTAILTGGVLTTLQLQDETQIWKDMQTLTNVISMDFNSNQTRYSYVLQNVLSQKPYFESPAKFVADGTALCIYNFNSTAFMTDVCSSLYHIRKLNKKLHSTPNAADLSSALTGRLFLAFGKTKEEPVDFISNLRTHKTARAPKNDFEFFVSETANHARVRNGCLKFRKQLTVDDVAGMYISKGNLTSMERSNHVYLAHPSVINVPAGQTGFVSRMQVISADKQITEDSFDHVAASTRSSLFTIYGLRSALALVDRVKDHPAFRASLGKYNSGNTPIDRAILVKRLNDEQKAFKEVWERMAKSGQGRYPKYAGISWPVKYIEDVEKKGPLDSTSHTNTNADQFTNEGYIPRMVKGTQYELVKGVVDIADGVNMIKLSAFNANQRSRHLLGAFSVNGHPISQIAGDYAEDNLGFGLMTSLSGEARSNGSTGEV